MKLEPYFHSNESIYTKCKDNVEHILATISNRYIGSHPPHPITYRAFCSSGLTRLKDYRYHFDFETKFPQCKNGESVYAWGKLWSDEAVEYMFALNCYGPVHLYVNGELKYRSTIVEELDPKKKVGFRLKICQGWNDFVLKFVKTSSGIGGIFGTGSFKRHPMHFLSPTAERDGQEGWIFTEPLRESFEQLPSELNGLDEKVQWYPEIKWPQLTSEWQMTRMFGNRQHTFAVAWSKINIPFLENKGVELFGQSNGRIDIFIENEIVFQTKGSSCFQIQVELPYGEHDVVIKSYCEQDDWGFEIKARQEEVQFQLPVPVKGANGKWLYAGLFEDRSDMDMKEIRQITSIMDAMDGPTFWRLDEPHLYVRPYLENRLFGKWDYPLGVTLYGLLQTGKELNRQDIISYAINHIETSTALYEYSLWDKEQYGAAGVNNQLSAIDSLDDCGSFGATMLLASEENTVKDADRVAHDIAHHISMIQDRLPDGTLYRKFGSVDFMKDTIWCDDLYMSTPFLCRYYQKTGDEAYLHDAVYQFLRYKEFLYLPHQKIMSHVYDFKFSTATGVPWGRGNGWVLFSLSELLAVLPENHSDRNELIAFFQELCEGYLSLQGPNGMWHQVLTDHDSYEETSCTAMFIYGFSRGIRYGWLKDKERYSESVFKGWESMSRLAIDQHGNVYGVCQGSGYSFTEDYYKNDLTWILNDTHGTGIVLLAGIETLKLKKSIKNRSVNWAKGGVKA